MMQVQTLINQKAIEAPGAKKPWWRFWKVQLQLDKGIKMSNKVS